MKSIFASQRRQFLKVGLIGSATLTLAACGVTSSRNTDKKNNYDWLQKDDYQLLAAIIPVMLTGALPERQDDRKVAVNEIIQGVDISVSFMPEAIRDEVRQLFNLLEFRVTRTLLAGIWSDWYEAEASDIEQFLTSWKESDFNLLQVAYTALHDLIIGSWYANPRSWQRINYPGPPTLV